MTRSLLRLVPGFTLLEILLVSGAVSILAGITVVALNPNKQLGDTRNAQRHADVNTLLSAIYQYAIDTRGTVPAAIPVGSTCGSSGQRICTMNGNCTGRVNLSPYIVSTTAVYLVGLPTDPLAATVDDTGYEVYKNAVTNRITVCAPHAEQNVVISASR